MIHARDDYQHIQDGTGRIPDDEPVMLFRGQDSYATYALEAYANALEVDDGDPEVIRKVREHAARMRDWPFQKMPDINPPE